MSVAIVNIEMQTSDVPALKDFLKKLKTSSIKIEQKDPTEMTKEEFLKMIDQSSKGKKYDMNFDELMQKTLSYGE